MLPWWLSNKESACQAGATGLIPHLGRSPGGEHGNPLQFLPGKSHGQRSLVGYSPWDRKESDTTELTQHTCTCHIIRATTVFVNREVYSYHRSPKSH